MRCKACWREAQRMARRAGAPTAAMNRITKRTYLRFHITNEQEQETCKHGEHINPSGYRRHSNGKVIALAATQNRS